MPAGALAIATASFFQASAAQTLLWAGMPAAEAQEINLIEERGQVSLGTFLNNSDMKVRVDGETRNGSVVNWDRTFGDKDVTRFRLDGLWRINDRHHVRLMYTDYSRNRTETIEEEIVWQGDTFPVNATVTGRAEFRDHRGGLRVRIHAHGEL